MSFVSNAGKSTAEQTSFDNATNGFSPLSKNVQLALEELKSAGSTAFNVYFVPVGQTYRILDNCENMCSGVQIVEGTLIIDGRNLVL